MARPLRIEYADALYHVTSRGNAQADIYLDENDRVLFQKVLGEVSTSFNWMLHAWCQMTNHYHLLIETPDANLSKGMRYLNGVYTQRFNRRHSRVGHVFQGRYKAILVERESHLLELCRYIVLNPVRAGMVNSAEHWKWSSYGISAGLETPPAWFDRERFLGAFSTIERAAIRQYIEFVAEGVQQPSPWSALKNQIYLGSERFVDAMQKGIKHKKLAEIPKAQRRPVPKALRYYDAHSETRNEAIYRAYRSGRYTLQAIGKHHGLHYSTISRIVKKMQKQRPVPDFAVPDFVPDFRHFL